MPILSIRIQILTIRKRFEAFEKDSNANTNHSNQIRYIQMQILTIRKAFEAFKSKFESFERDSKHLHQISNLSKGIRSFQM